MQDNDFSFFEDLLKRLHQEHVDKRKRLEESRQNLSENQIEFEENAANAQMATPLEQLDDQEESRLVAIEHALERLRTGLYSTCASCGAAISIKRLKAIPWTSQCIVCAGGERPDDEEEDMDEEDVAPAEDRRLPAELQGLDDEQVVAAVRDALIRDKEVPLEELDISCRNGVLRLEGVMPAKRQYSRLQQIVYDTLGFHDVEDRVVIDRTAWERGDRTSGRQKDDEPEEEKIDSEDGSGAEVTHAIKGGKSITPADEIIPEKRGGEK